MKYHFKVVEEDVGYSAICLELEGCITEGDNTEDLLKNMKDALESYLDEPEGHIAFPLPMDIEESDSVRSVEIEPELAFALMLRHARIENKLTQREVAEKLGMRSLFNYQRLERRSNPTLSLIKKIRSVFPGISIDSI